MGSGHEHGSSEIQFERPLRWALVSTAAQTAQRLRIPWIIGVAVTTEKDAPRS